MKRTVMLGTVAAIVLGSAIPVLAAGRDRMGMGSQGPMGPQVEFSDLDADGDGQITPAEARAYAAKKFAEADTDGNGSLTVDEMAERVGEQAKQEAMERAKSRIEQMVKWRDADGDGALSAAEMGEGPAAMMLQRLDRDGNGSVSAEEFAAARQMGRGDRGDRGEMRGHGDRGDRHEHGDRGDRGGKRGEMRGHGDHDEMHGDRGDGGGMGGMGRMHGDDDDHGPRGDRMMKKHGQMGDGNGPMGGAGNGEGNGNGNGPAASDGETGN